MALQFRRGKEAIAKANESTGGGGSFTPYLPNIYWKDDKQTRLVWILNPIDDIPMAKTIKAFTTDKRTEYVIARQDDAIGASSDPIEDEWGYGPADSNICIAVELEAVVETRRGRDRPVSFAVATREFTRKERDEDGKETGKKETVEAPIVGVIVQSPSNFFNHLSSKDTTVGPVHEFPLQILRDGDDKDTDYEIEVFEDKPLNTTGLMDNWENISYLTEEDRDDLFELLEKAEDESEEAQTIGAYLLDKWLNEHAEESWYNEILGKIANKAKYPSKKYQEANGGGSSKSEDKPKRERAAKPSQRRAKVEAEPEGDADSEDAEPTDAEIDAAEATSSEADQGSSTEPEVEAEVEEKPKAKRTRRTPAKKADDDEAPVSKSSPIKERMEKLRAETAAKAKAAAA